MPSSISIAWTRCRGSEIEAHAIVTQTLSKQQQRKILHEEDYSKTWADTDAYRAPVAHAIMAIREYADAEDYDHADSFRIAILGDPASEQDFNARITCCGCSTITVDVVAEDGSVTHLKAGCNYGH
jgi:hypothetical protein